MNKIDIAERFANMWITSRTKAGKSQEYMAKALGVSKKTIQNWEDGTSCPSQLKGFEWFHALGIQPLPYYLQLLYPSFVGINPASSDEQIDDALCSLIKDLPAETKRKLLFIANGDHGSSPVAVLEMIVADMNTPLRARLNIAQTIMTNYEMAEASGTTCPIKPDMELLDAAFNRAKQSVKNSKNGYTAAVKEDE